MHWYLIGLIELFYRSQSFQKIMLGFHISVQKAFPPYSYFKSMMKSDMEEQTKRFWRCAKAMNFHLSQDRYYWSQSYLTIEHVSISFCVRTVIILQPASSLTQDEPWVHMEPCWSHQGSAGLHSLLYHGHKAHERAVGSAQAAPCVPAELHWFQLGSPRVHVSACIAKSGTVFAISN